MRRYTNAKLADSHFMYRDQQGGCVMARRNTPPTALEFIEGLSSTARNTASSIAGIPLYLAVSVLRPKA